MSLYSLVYNNERHPFISKDGYFTGLNFMYLNQIEEEYLRYKQDPVRHSFFKFSEQVTFLNPNIRDINFIPL